MILNKQKKKPNTRRFFYTPNHALHRCYCLNGFRIRKRFINLRELFMTYIRHKFLLLHPERDGLPVSVVYYLKALSGKYYSLDDGLSNFARLNYIIIISLLLLLSGYRTIFFFLLIFSQPTLYYNAQCWKITGV